MNDRQPVERHHRIAKNNVIDRYVGKRRRSCCAFLGLSQEQLRAKLNITFRWVQKYKRSATWTSASRLWDMSQILDVPVSYFFDGLSETTQHSSPRRVARSFDDDSAADGEVKVPMARRETLELVRGYYTIKRPEVCKRVSDMVRSVATALTRD